MKKLFLFLAAMMTATVMNLQAATTYYIMGKGSSDSDWCCGYEWMQENCQMYNRTYSVTVPAGIYEFAVIEKITNGGQPTEYHFLGYDDIDESSSTPGYEKCEYYSKDAIKFVVSSQATINVSTDGSDITLTSTVPFGADYLHFVGLNGNNTVRLNKNGMFYNTLTAKIQYSMDRKDWTDYSWNAKEGTAIALAEGDTVFFRAGGSGLNTTFSTSANSYFRFVFGDNDSIAAGGNIMSLYDASCEKLSMTSYGFYKLFYSCDALVSAPKMPATTVDTYCYQSMFQGCAGLQSVPETLPATMLASCCYHSMFSKCTNLTSAPALPATTLASGCYTNMFNGCSALTQAPELKATSLTASCYYAMFKQCTSLVNIPVLEATTLATYCYYQMFSGCSQFEVSELSGPCEGVELTLPVPTELTDTCIQGMFDGCLIKDSIQFGGSYCIKECIAPYGRKVTNGNYGTICLDRKIKNMEGVDGLFVPYEKNETTLYCEEVALTDVVAGGAYIFKSNADSVTFFMEGEAAAAVEDNYMLGWLGDTTNIDATFLTTYANYSLLANNTIIKPEAGSTLLPNRAMINMKDVPAKAAAPARGRTISFGINGTTGMVDVNATRMSDVHKLVNNGQLIIIREGRKFNAQGQEL